MTAVKERIPVPSLTQVQAIRTLSRALGRAPHVPTSEFEARGYICYLLGEQARVRHRQEVSCE